ncbi:ParB/RepB/Spo0J family partition protein [Paracoccus sp. MC1854]|uniref:ParB/RepB/Spo0J family partition protein n=1 Tax=Paracoccus sp. MC1854 TaxID=2760306 RepID=UPI00351C1928
MSKRHNAIFDDLLRDMDDPAPAAEKGGTRFLKRSNALADSGTREEKVLRWVDPASCVMWERHNRAYDLLNETNCRELIDSIRAQGQQEFPAIVRRRSGEGAEYEVICGARRHFAISWLRANNYPQFRYLVEVRDLTDEEAFRLADIENRDRADLSDYERARDYARALDLYYGGKQKAMAARLEVSEAWLSRYLYLARLPEVVVRAWPQITDLKELHARTLRPLLSDAGDRVLAEATAIAAEQDRGRAGQGASVPVPRVLARLKAATAPAAKVAAPSAKLRVRERGREVTLQFDRDIDEPTLRAELDRFLAERFG